jgi:S-DNA-T family DNA segregation ATPase FtsK/SpoIIIE
MVGEKGAERLLGKGDVAVKLEGEDEIITAQVPFITPQEIETIVSSLK